MISIQKKFLFIHVPKTGGNSIQGILKNYSEDIIITRKKGENGFDERFELKNRKYKIKKHASLYQYKKVLEPDIYNSLFKFAVIRNPWDRMISYYFSPNLGVVKWEKEKFIKFVNNVKPLKYYIAEYNLLDKVFYELNLNVKNDRSKLDENIDYIIKFENIEKDFEKVCKKLSIPYQTLPVVNKSYREHYSKYYDEELIELVKRKYRDEIELFNYKFETV